ncbi:MAG: hypothetical protein FWF44_08295, partial [Defluviitaleaceae bacterium]|nr:hypothetical protein [Defluviitaleaceae bacterium]
IGYFIHSALNPAPKTYLEMAIMDASTTMDDRDVITNALNAALIPADEAGKYVFQIDDFYMAPDDASDYAQALSQKFSAMLFARQINLMMFGDASLEGLGEEGLYTDLSTIFDESELSAHEDQVVRKEFPSDNDMTGQTANGMYPCALKLAGSEFFTSLGFDVSNMYLAVYYTGQSDDAMKQAIEYIMGW